MGLDTINKLYLELSQVATAKTAREIELEKVAKRRGELLEKIFIEYRTDISKLDNWLYLELTNELAALNPSKYFPY